jgi:hypothetical protein
MDGNGKISTAILHYRSTTYTPILFSGDFLEIAVSSTVSVFEKCHWRSVDNEVIDLGTKFTAALC